MTLPNYKDIFDLIKAGATIEAQERVMELRQEALSLQEENIRLRTKVSELEGRVKELEAIDGDPCPRCRKPAWVVASSQPDGVLGIVGGIRRTYKCNECGLTESIVTTPK